MDGADDGSSLSSSSSSDYGEDADVPPWVLERQRLHRRPRSDGDNRRPPLASHEPSSQSLPSPPTSCPRGIDADSPAHRLSRTVLHLDIDSFYGQYHELSDPSTFPSGHDVPLAVGQKHIVVTCNYPARNRGVKKLMLKTDALRICPELAIVDGSDLEPYKKASRRIYDAFRSAVSEACARCRGAAAVVTKKGGMDEMYADVTDVVAAMMASGEMDDGDDTSIGREGITLTDVPAGTFVYGDNKDPSSKQPPATAVTITEDQTGATSTTVLRHRTGAITDKTMNQLFWGGISPRHRSECATRLRCAATIAFTIRNAVRQTSGGYRSCIGVSTSPMLSKIASDLNKPDSINVLYPWRSTALVSAMPLRRVPGLGSKTMKALVPCLERYNAATGGGEGEARVDESSSLGLRGFWTCRDLLNVPRDAVVACLSGVRAFGASSERQCDVLLQRCRGIDPVPVLDDGGGLPKTVSVEDSFKRGTVRGADAVRAALEPLFVRLPRLLEERRRWSRSDRSESSCPTTIRLSMRFLRESSGAAEAMIFSNGDMGRKRRPYIVVSRQCPFDGNALLRAEGPERRSALLRSAVSPLLDGLLSTASHRAAPIVVTRLNVAATGFADLNCDTPPEQASPDGQRQSKLAQFFALADPVEATVSGGRGPSQGSEMPRSDGNKRTMVDVPMDADAALGEEKAMHSTCRKRPLHQDSAFASKPPPSSAKGDGKKAVVALKKLRWGVADPRASTSPSANGMQVPAGVDPKVLAELPPDIVAEIVGARRVSPSAKKTGRGIECYFNKSKKIQR